MIFDNLTNVVLVWAAAVFVAVIALQACKGCCIAKLRGKPCDNGPGI